MNLYTHQYIYYGVFQKVNKNLFDHQDIMDQMSNSKTHQSAIKP